MSRCPDFEFRGSSERKEREEQKERGGGERLGRGGREEQRGEEEGGGERERNRKRRGEREGIEGRDSSRICGAGHHHRLAVRAAAAPQEHRRERPAEELRRPQLAVGGRRSAAPAAARKPSANLPLDQNKIPFICARRAPPRPAAVPMPPGAPGGSTCGGMRRTVTKTAAAQGSSLSSESCWRRSTWCCAPTASTPGLSALRPNLFLLCLLNWLLRLAPCPRCRCFMLLSSQHSAALEAAPTPASQLPT